MTGRSLSSETLHACCVAIEGRAILIGGRSGSGKSDLALRLVDRGAALVSDDYVIVRRAGAALVAAPPPTIEGRMEVRGIGIVELPFVRDVPVALMVELVDSVERMPPAAERRHIAGIPIPVVALDPREPSAPIKAELALRRLGLPA